MTGQNLQIDLVDRIGIAHFCRIIFEERFLDRRAAFEGQLALGDFAASLPPVPVVFSTTGSQLMSWKLPMIFQTLAGRCIDLDRFRHLQPRCAMARRRPKARQAREHAGKIRRLHFRFSPQPFQHNAQCIASIFVLSPARLVRRSLVTALRAASSLSSGGGSLFI